MEGGPASKSRTREQLRARKLARRYTGEQIRMQQIGILAAPVAVFSRVTLFRLGQRAKEVIQVLLSGASLEH